MFNDGRNRPGLRERPSAHEIGRLQQPCEARSVEEETAAIFLRSSRLFVSNVLLARTASGWRPEHVREGLATSARNSNDRHVKFRLTPRIFTSAIGTEFGSALPCESASHYTAAHVRQSYRRVAKAHGALSRDERCGVVRAGGRHGGPDRNGTRS